MIKWLVIKSALKISIVKFSFYFVCGININWFSTNAFFFRLFSTGNTRVFKIACNLLFVSGVLTIAS